MEVFTRILNPALPPRLQCFGPANWVLLHLLQLIVFWCALALRVSSAAVSLQKRLILPLFNLVCHFSLSPHILVLAAQLLDRDNDQTRAHANHEARNQIHRTFLQAGFLTHF